MSSGSITANAGPPKPSRQTVVRREPKRRRLTNSISLLPTELLCKIFEYVCSPHSLAPFSPLTLSHVDSSFRSIVLDTPSLWSTIDDNFPPPIAKLYLERSLPAPLDIRVGSSGSSAVENGKVDQLFQYLKPHAHRVKALKIVMTGWEPIIRMEELMNGDIRFNGLEKLEFGCCENWHPTARPLMFELDEPDSLRELHLWGYELNQWVDRFPTALRLLHLTDAVVRFEELLVALAHSPGLGVLVLDDCNLLEDAEIFMTAGGLVELRFIMIDPGQMDRFVSFIKMPALTSLSVAANTAPVSNDFLVNLLKSSKEILSVEICDYGLTADDWLSIFKHLANLTHLRVRASYSADEDLQALTMTQTLPNLTSITLDNELRLTTLFVEQVARAHPKLESVVLRGWDPSNVSADSLAAISKLVKNILVETFRRSPEEDCEEETESDTSDDFSMDDLWLSGDEHVVRRKGNA
ncbi:hypothetical protein FRC00_000605 [Tulasnella sp. 408]|nr:hypothetical protein FRC00_000605 [Tulasnella sp. 408]